MSKFWLVYKFVNLAVILALGGILIWAGFDIHNRLHYLWLAQFPALAMMVVRRLFMRAEK